MEQHNLFLIDQKEGLEPNFSHLVSMMTYTRATTLAEIQRLSTKQLDYRFQADANSIGMLLAHIAAVETYFQIDTFEGREVTDEEISQLNPALDLGIEAQEICGHPVDYYMKKLEDSRRKTLETFQTIPDSWLFRQSAFGDHPANNFFKWFHVFEDELSHRGQIRLIKKMMK